MQCRYISDLHLYDAYSIEWRGDIYNYNLDLYAINLMDTWNTFTSTDDIVIVVGDIGNYCPRTLDVLSRLNGTKILVKGNHDIQWHTELYRCGIFKGIHDEISNNGIFVKHNPYGDRGDCKYYIHGHHHRYDMPGMNSALQLYARDVFRLNCAADLLNNKPCTIQELILQKELLVDKYTGILI